MSHILTDEQAAFVIAALRKCTSGIKNVAAYDGAAMPERQRRIDMHAPDAIEQADQAIELINRATC